MIIKNKNGALVVIPTTYVVDGELKDYVKGTASYDSFWSGFDLVAKDIIKTGFNPMAYTYPLTFNFKGITLRLDEPYAINATVGIHHGGAVQAATVDIVRPKGKAVLTTRELTKGVILETPLCMILSAQLKRAFALERQRISYLTWTMVAKIRSQQMIDQIDNELLSFKNHPAITFVFPESIFIKQGENLIVSAMNETPWLNGITREDKTYIDVENTLLLQDFYNKTVDLYKGAYGFTGTIDELRAQLIGNGVSVTISDNWLVLQDQKYFEGQMTPEFRKFLEQFPEQILSTFPYYIKHTYGGLDLTGQELASTLYDFSRVLNKLCNRSIKYRAEDQVGNIYELMTIIMKKLETPMSLLDISDFIIFHNLRLGSIRFQLDSGPSDLTVQEYEMIKEISKKLTTHVADTSYAAMITKTVDDKLQLTINGRIFIFNVIIGDHVYNKTEVIDCLLSTRTLGYRCVEMLESIEGIYLACLNTALVPGSLYNLMDGVYKFEIPMAYLHSQLHPGLVPANFQFYIPEA